MPLLHRAAIALSAIILAAGVAAAQPAFTEVTPLNDPLWVTDANSDFWINAVAPADVDGDGDLDLAVLGFYVVYNETVTDRLVIFLNQGQGADGRWVFVTQEVPLNGIAAGASDLAWGDFDQDGDPDLAVGSEGATVVYRNDGGFLTPLPNALPGYFEDSSYTGAYDLRSISWADIDNDGDLDLLVPSVFDFNNFQYQTHLLRNDGSDGTGGWIFTDTVSGLDPTTHAQTAWADDDGDGDLDLFMLNIDDFTETGFVRRYENQGGHFQGQDLLGIVVNYGVADWGDYDGDGDMDILVAGNIREADGTFDTVLRIYRNDGGGTYVPLNLPAPRPGWLDYQAASWADYNSDGLMDLLVTGSYVGDGEIVGASEIYENRGGEFVPIGANLSAPVESVGRGGTFSWLDIDGDGDLDYLVAGAYFVPGGNGLVEAQIHLYRNDAASTNRIPSAPSQLSATDTGNGNVLLSWNPGGDDGTATPAITYDLIVKPSTGLETEVSPQARRGRRLPEPGNISAVNNWHLRNLPAGTYDWAVRAVDSAYNGSPRAIGSFTVTRPPKPAVTLARPKPGATVKGVVPIRVLARDDQDAIDKLHVFVVVAGQAIPATYEPATQLYRADWNSTSVNDGVYSVRAFATDSQSNRGQSQAVSVTVDNIP